MLFSHNTKRIVPVLSVNKASCLRSVLPLDRTVSSPSLNVIRPQTFATVLASPSKTCETVVIPGLHLSSDSIFLISKDTSESSGSDLLVRLFIWTSSCCSSLVETLKFSTVMTRTHISRKTVSAFLERNILIYTRSIL
jgi:hypothetical protein